MHLWENLKIGIGELASHKLRSLLTMLGVIFGVGAVVAVVAIGLGARAEALRQVALLGTNNIRIQKLDLDGFERAEARRKAPDGITRADLKALLEVSPAMLRGAGRRDINARTYHAGESPPADVSAIQPGYLRLLGIQFEEGSRDISGIENEQGRLVCILGHNLARIFFPLEDPIGKSIQIGRLKYKIIGVLKRRAESGGGDQDLNVNLAAFIPLGSAIGRLTSPHDSGNLNELVIEVDATADLEAVKLLVERVMKQRHRDAEDYTIIIPELLLKQKQATQRIFGVVLLFIAGLSLVTGGIGIMNIMLATVTQRTKEIGVRRALGATRQDILGQFLIEALLICLIGGMIGISVGWGLSRGAEYYAGWETIINWPAVVIALTVATSTGLLFGLYPSLQAAKLDPIEALRHE